MKQFISMLDKRESCVLGSMTYMASVSLEQKRLEQLKQQLFGKPDSTPVKISTKQLKDLTLREAAVNSTVALESLNLKSDLVKIAVLSTIALAIQISLFFAIHNGFLKLF